MGTGHGKTPWGYRSSVFDFRFPVQKIENPQSKIYNALMQTAIIIVDHGSRRPESNQLLHDLVLRFAQRFAGRYLTVEPAHMELAEPSIATAYARCAAKDARRIIVCPFFLAPGKHWTEDIPRLTADAAKSFPQTQFHVTPTLGIDDLMLDLLEKRISGCGQNQFDCPTCHGAAHAGTMAPKST